MVEEINSIKRHAPPMMAITVLFVLCFTPLAYAQCGALCLYEVGTPNSGSSAAGAGATAQDASTAYFNPAGMTRLDRSQVLMGSNIAFVDMQFLVNPNETISVPPGDTGGSGQIAGFLPGAGSYMVMSITDDLKLGFSLNVPYGGTTDYREDWVGRWLVTENSLIVLNIEPALALRVTDWLSIGAGLNIYYALFNQDFVVDLGPITGGAPFPDLGPGRAHLRIKDADDWAVGYTPSILLEPFEGTRIGVVYRSKAEVKLKGTFQNPTTLALEFGDKFDLPQGINASLYHQLTPKLALLADGGWTDWSEFGQQLMRLGPTTSSIDRKWRDTWRAAAGFQYQIDDNWLFQSGFSYDSQPIRAANRTPDLPVSEAYRISVGTQYNWDDNHTLGISYTYVDFGDGEVDQVALPPNGEIVLDGEHSPFSAHLVGLTYIWRFGAKPSSTKQ